MLSSRASRFAEICILLAILLLSQAVAAVDAKEKLLLEFEHTREGSPAIAVFRVHVDTKAMRIIWMQRDASAATDGFCRFEGMHEIQPTLERSIPNRTIPMHPDWRPVIANGRELLVSSNISHFAAELSDGRHKVQFALQMCAVGGNGKRFEKVEILMSSIFEIEIKKGLLAGASKINKTENVTFEYPIGGFKSGEN